MPRGCLIALFHVRIEVWDRIRVSSVSESLDVAKSLQRDIQGNFERLLEKHGLSGYKTVKTSLVENILRSEGGKFPISVNLLEMPGSSEAY